MSETGTGTAAGGGDRILDCRNAHDGTAIRVHTRGHGPTLLMLHGWTLDHRSFEAQAPLAETFRLASFDRRGFGESAAPPDLGTELGDVDAVIDVLGGEPVHLLGVSQGARLALRYAALNPPRVKSLIVQGVIVDNHTPAIEDDAPIPLEHYRALIEDGRIATMRREWLAHPMMSSDPIDASDRARLEQMLDGYTGRDLSGPGASAMPELPPLSKLEPPTLVITGERESAARKAHAAYLRDTAPHAREVVLPACGHLSNLGRPDVYNALVRSFLDDAVR